MKHAHRTDFLFGGVAVLPALLMVAGYVEAVFMLFCPLLIVACLCGMYEQKMEPEVQKPLRDAKATVLPSAAAAAQNSQLTLSELNR